MKIRVFALLMCFIPLAVTSVLANNLSEFWSQKRSELLEKGKASCNSRAIFKELRKKADQGDPVAAYWIYVSAKNPNCSTFRDVGTAEGAAYVEQSIEAGYPVAMKVYGKDLLYGYSGYKQNASRGESLLKSAYENGWANAGGELAYAYGKGNVLQFSKEKALSYLEGALELGMSKESADVIVKASKPEIRREARIVANTAIAGANAQVPKTTNQQQASNNQQQTSSNQQQSTKREQFAALAVQDSDGTFGYAFDFPTRDQAVKRAVSECRKNGGNDCSAKLVLQGPACIAYHSTTKGSAYGWGFSSSSGEAENRARRECAKYNGGKSCESTSWSCNSRSQGTLKVVMEKPNASVQRAAAVSGPKCDFTLSLRCRIPGKKLSTHFAHESKVFGTRKMIAGGFNSCEESRKYRQVIYRQADGKDIIANESVWNVNEDRFRMLVDRMRDRVLSEFPGCTSQSGNKQGVGTISIIHGSRNKKSRLNNTAPGQNNHKDNRYGDGSPEYYWIKLE